MQISHSNITSTVVSMLKSQVIDLKKISAKTLADRCHLKELTIKGILDGMPLNEEIAVKLELGTNISSSA